jgi:ferrous iron transport protein A
MDFYKNKITLDNLPIGYYGEVLTLNNTGPSRRRLLDLGLTPKTIVKTERISPLGDPIAFNIRGAIIALRKEEAKNIIINPLNRGE